MKRGERARYWMKYKARKKYYDLGMYRKMQARTEEE